MSLRQLAFDLPVRPALDREAFFVGPSNAAAVAMIDAGARWPGRALVLAGPEASGKTHLVHVWAARRGAVVVEAAALGRLDVPTLARSGRVAVENVPDIAGCRREEAALFHLYNLTLGDGGRVLMTGRPPPARWPLALPDLSSRVRGAALVALDAPDDALLAALLSKHFADRQLAVPEGVIPYLLARMRRSAAAAHALAVDLDRLSLAERHRVTIPLARRALERAGMQPADPSQTRDAP